MRLSDPAGASRRSLRAGGMRVSYLRAGPDDAGPAAGADAPPVVLVHGGGLDSAALPWREVSPALAGTGEFVVYAPNLPGYSRSGRPEETPTAAYYARVVGEFLAELDLTDTRLAGVSLGGTAVVGATLAAPERVARLAPIYAYGLGSTVPGGPLAAAFVRVPWLAGYSWRAIRGSRALTALAVRGIVAPGNATPALIDEVSAALATTDGREWRRLQRAEVTAAGLRTCYLDRLSTLRAPTLYVHGERDPLVPSAWSVRAAAMTSEATPEVLANCGH